MLLAGSHTHLNQLGDSDVCVKQFPSCCGMSERTLRGDPIFGMEMCNAAASLARAGMQNSEAGR